MLWLSLKDPTNIFCIRETITAIWPASFAAHWGNEAFAPLKPRESMVFVAEAQRTAQHGEREDQRRTAEVAGRRRDPAQPGQHQHERVAPGAGQQPQRRSGARRPPAVTEPSTSG